ncbi:MAG TPA: response regulator transcription factor [Ktedonobacterales bacterium]|nr:response regulator transcription factor [Ktedonobacterales bacterium]
MKAHVLLVDDDRHISQVLRRALVYDGYSVDVAHNGNDALQKSIEHPPDVVILDIMLPGMSGLEVCDRLRKSGNQVPILMLTAKDAIADRVAGLDMGADDYLVKPVDLSEFQARVRALLRRRNPEQTEVLRFADLELDTGTRVAHRGKRPIELSTTEYELLALFMRRPRQVLTRDIIMERVWGYDFEGESNVLEVYIGYLRTKLEAEDEPRLIHTVRGAGYVLREKPDSQSGPMPAV